MAEKVKVGKWFDLPPGGSKFRTLTIGDVEGVEMLHWQGGFSVNLGEVTSPTYRYDYLAKQWFVEQAARRKLL